MGRVRVNDSTEETASCVCSFPNSTYHGITAVEGKEDNLWGLKPQTSTSRLIELSQQF